MNLITRIHNENDSEAGLAQARYSEFFTHYFERVSAQPKRDMDVRQVSIIARSPESPVVGATLLQSGELKRHGISVRAIFADLGPDGALLEFGDAIADLADKTDARDLVRWARNSCLKEAHEQLILSADMCWTGDCMRRQPGKRDSLDLFETEAPQVVRLGVLAFDAIWTISETVPLSRITTMPVKPSAAYAAGHEDHLSAFSFLRKPNRINPLRH